MKHLITLFLTVLFMSGMQNVQAQSKEETIQWLNDYGRKMNYKYITVSKSGLEWSYASSFSGFDGEFLNFDLLRSHEYGYYEETYKVSPKDILYKEISTLEGDKFTLKAKVGSVFFSGKATAVGEVGVTYNGSKEKESKESDILFYFRENESKDAQRLFKAIMHLAKLSGADELPKVTENTF